MFNSSFDHSKFYINDKPFFPIISSDIQNDVANTIAIKVDCSNYSTLIFEQEYEKANKLKELRKYIIWDVSLGLENPDFLLSEELYLQSILQSLNYFIENIYLPFKEISIGIALYTGKIPRYNSRLNSFESWLDGNSFYKNHDLDEAHLMNLFNCEILTDYMRLIAPSIPDELPMILKLDVTEIENKAQLIHLLSKDRFEYFLLALKGAKIPLPAISWESGEGRLGQFDNLSNTLQKKTPNVGVCFPTSQRVTQAELFQFNNIFNDLSSNNIDFRVFDEVFATEQWDELDYIIARKNSLSSAGIRMLQGFLAAMGTTVYHELPIGILDEMSFDKFKKSFPIF